MKDGWVIHPLGDLCSIRPPKSEAKVRLKDSDLVSFLPMEDLDIDNKHPVPRATRALMDVEGSYTYFADGDVLLAKITPCFENGKLGIASGLTNGCGFGSSEFFVIRPPAILDTEYLYYFLSRASFRVEGARSMGGAVGHQRVTKEFIESYPVPVPPLPEQQRIVAILDEAFEGLALAAANAEKNLKYSRELFDSYLDAVFIRRGEIWEKRPLGEVCENLDSRRVPVTKRVRSEGSIPYYGASGIVDYVSGHIFDEDILLVSEDGANLLARTYPIAFSVSGKCWVNNHAHVLRFARIDFQRLIEFYLNSISLAPFVSGMALPKLNQKALNSIPVPVPPVAEQAQIVRRLEALSGEARQLEEAYQAKLNGLSELKQSLLAKAFAGELT